MSDRIHNFSAGPATLPVELLEKARDEFLNFAGAGMSVMEMSHRSKEFTGVIEQAESDIRELLKLDLATIKKNKDKKKIKAKYNELISYYLGWDKDLISMGGEIAETLRRKDVAEKIIEVL